MDIYLITDNKRKQHEFIYPDRVWMPGENGWVSREVQLSDRKLRLEVCFSLVKNAVNGRRVGSSNVIEAEEEKADVATIH